MKTNRLQAMTQPAFWRSRRNRKRWTLAALVAAFPAEITFYESTDAAGNLRIESSPPVQLLVAG